MTELERTFKKLTGLLEDASGNAVDGRTRSRFESDGWVSCYFVLIPGPNNSGHVLVLSGDDDIFGEDEPQDLTVSSYKKYEDAVEAYESWGL